MTSQLLPLFPLETVLFPGEPLLLQVFEERYRALVTDILEGPAKRPRRFGVVAIELGHEVGKGRAQRLAKVGCTAEIRDVTRFDDGRFDVHTTGGTRFYVEEFDEPAQEAAYPRGRVTMLTERAGNGATVIGALVATMFRRYRLRLRELGAAQPTVADLPAEPVALSYAVASGMIIGRADRQLLLEAEHATARLDAERRMLAEENRILDALPSLPAADLVYTRHGDVN